MKISIVQMDMKFCAVDENFEKAKRLIRAAAKEQPDVIVLPETWNTGFFPRENLQALCDCDCARVKRELGSLAKELHVNLLAGSVSNLRDGKVFNTACVFDRSGNLIAQYDKTHLFTPMGEHEYFAAGDHLCTFCLDGVPCALIICYDVRFCELVRTLALTGAKMLFCVAQWPEARVNHLETLIRARAIENQMFAVCCNSCGEAGQTQYAGHSAIVDPWGVTLAQADEKEQIITADCDLSVVENIRSSINVFRDRRPELYDIQ